MTTLLQDEEWVQRTDTAIAKACAVSSNFFGDVRRAILNPIKDSQVPETWSVTRNGTTCEQNTASISKAANMLRTADLAPPDAGATDRVA